MGSDNYDSSTKEDEDDVDDIKLTGCGALPCCDPRSAGHRFTVLIFICFLSFGSYFCFDNPAALQKQITTDMKVNTEKFMLLYSLYSWPNVVLCFFGGFLLDKVFGIRLGTIIFGLFVCVGQVIFSLGAVFDSYTMMEAGRFVFGIGGESLAVAQNTYAVSWFKGAELNMVFGLQLSFSRVGSTVNMNVMGPMYKFLEKRIDKESYVILGWTLMVGFLFCLLSLFCSLAMAFFDKRAARILKKQDAQTGEEIRITDVKDFPLSVWLIFIICVTYYVAVFPFISLGLVYFEAKYDLDASKANIVNSLVYLISAGASPILGLYVDKVGYNLYQLIAAICMTIGAHAMLAFSTTISPYIAMSVMGIGYSLLACALWPLVAMIVPEYQLGTAYGFMQSIQNLGLAVVSIIAGSIVDNRGYLILEVFFLACLSLALISSILLYLSDLSSKSGLNLSAKVRKEAKSNAKTEINNVASENKPLLENYYTKPPQGTSSVNIQPRSAAALRYQFIAKLGGPTVQMPETFRTSAFIFPHVLK
ncbi:lysosomal dipeptide transporter MFSD1-like [Clytia hemisphaerica]|uniref:lysosomal dipeptide transporter MFSD1-like n=1 Tax=Clytia hemisphaerica TaxID=252671 RepID=UPI0034D56174|eukprot:TCONS_00010328-protein